MKTKKILIALSLLLFIAQGLIAEESNLPMENNNAPVKEDDDFPIMIKAWGGCKFTPLGSLLNLLYPAADNQSYGFSVDGQLLLYNLKYFQFGVGFAYLPVLKTEYSIQDDNGIWADIKMFSYIFPLTADVVFNIGIFYINAGFGVGWLSGKPKVYPDPGMDKNTITEELQKLTPFDAGFVFAYKSGLGFNIPLGEDFAIDFGINGYIPFGGGLSTSSDENTGSLLSMYLLSLLNAHIGVSYSL